MGFFTYIAKKRRPNTQPSQISANIPLYPESFIPIIFERKRPHTKKETAIKNQANSIRVESLKKPNISIGMLIKKD